MGHGSPGRDERNVESCAINHEDEQYAYKILQDVFFPRYSSIKHYSWGFLPKEDKGSNNIMKNSLKFYMNIKTLRSTFQEGHKDSAGG